MKDLKVFIHIVIVISLLIMTFMCIFQFYPAILNITVLPGWANFILAWFQVLVILFIDYKFGKFIYKKYLKNLLS